MSVTKFVKEHDIAEHLLAAIDDQRSGDWAAFEGIQYGLAVVGVTWDGVKIGLISTQKAEAVAREIGKDLAKIAEASGLFEPGTIEVKVEKIEDLELHEEPIEKIGELEVKDGEVDPEKRDAILKKPRRVRQ
jgi:hypothetical protein